VVTFSTGTSAPHYLGVGDFNGDGKPDLAVPDFSGTTISVYLTQKSGSFASPVVTNLPISNTLGAILSGDFNGDGKADLVVATVSGSQDAIVLLGNGDGTFAVQPPITGSFGFLSGKVADFNGDGHPDLLLGGDGSPYLFLGQGNGTFSQGSVGKGSSPGDYFGVSAGDFNGDKHLDGILTDLGQPGNQLGAIDFLPGDGSGALGNAVSYQPALIQNPESVDVADFNGDGKADLLVGGNGAAFVILGNGDGTFQIGNSQLIIIYAQNYVPGGANADEVLAIVADLNADGIPDAVVVNYTTGLLSLVVNDGTGKFPDALSTPYTLALAPESYAVATADFNGDGLPDIVVANTNAKTISVLLSIKVPTTPSITLTSSGNNLLVGTSLMLKAALSGGTPAATGTVSLLDGSSQIAQQSLDATGAATFNLSDLDAGVHSLSLTYAGDSNYASATSAVISQSVTDFQVTATPTSATVSAGSTANYTLTITPIAGFAGTVAVTCTGLPSLAACNAPSITVGSGVSAITTTVAVSTTASTSAVSRKPDGTAYACLLLSCFSFFHFVRSNKRVGKGLVRFLPIFLLALVFGASGCGGGTSKPTIPGTPSGTSTMTITATVTQNGVTVTHSATAVLVVQ
jgi:hypothetical protein